MSHPEADVLFTAVVLLVAVLALLFGGVLIAEPLIPLGPDILAMSPRVFPTLILTGTALVASIFLVTKGMQGTRTHGLQARRAIRITRVPGSR